MVLLTTVVVVAVLRLAQEVFIPLALAILLTFLLAPLVERMTRWHINRALAVIVSLVIAFALIGGLLDLVFNQFSDLTHQLPSYQRQLRINLTHLSGALRGGVAETTKAVEQLTREIDRVAPSDPRAHAVSKVQVVPAPPTGLETLREVIGPLLRPLGTTLAVVVLVAFMLLRLPDLRERLMRLLGSRNLHLTTQALNDAANRVSRYLLMQILINGWTGLWVAVGLWFLHVPNAGLWGVLTLVLRFIPYVGVLLAASMPFALSVSVFDTWTVPMMVFGLFAVLEFFSYSVLEPWLYGTHTGVSPVALLLAAGFWTWLWGFAGLFLAVPMTVCVVVIGTYIPQLKFLQVLLGDEPVLEPHERLYQRLLSSNRDEADSVLHTALRSDSMLEVCDSMIIPAMLLAKQDHDRGNLTDTKQQLILEHIRLWVDEQIEAAPASARGAGRMFSPSRATVVCVAAADRADEVIARLLQSVLLEQGLDASTVAAGSAVPAELSEDTTRAVVISALPPEAVSAARAVCKSVRRGSSSLPIIVGLWNAQGDLERPRQRLQAAGATRLVTSFAACFAMLQTALRTPDSTPADGRLAQLPVPESTQTAGSTGKAPATAAPEREAATRVPQT
ncbi:MAG TPA: AI-2E family transporter [Steroidobacteraceae bacterium]